jgi:hypothetical protein
MAEHALLVAVRCLLDRVLCFTRLHFTFPPKLGMRTIGDASDQQCILLPSIACNAPCNTNSFFFIIVCFCPYVFFVHITASHLALHTSFCFGGLLVPK